MFLYILMNNILTPPDEESSAALNLTSSVSLRLFGFMSCDGVKDLCESSVIPLVPERREVDRVWAETTKTETPRRRRRRREQEEEGKGLKSAWIRLPLFVPSNLPSGLSQSSSCSSKSASSPAPAPPSPVHLLLLCFLKLHWFYQLLYNLTKSSTKTSAATYRPRTHKEKHTEKLRRRTNMQTTTCAG